MANAATAAATTTAAAVGPGGAAAYCLLQAALARLGWVHEMNNNPGCVPADSDGCALGLALACFGYPAGRAAARCCHPAPVVQGAFPAETATEETINPLHDGDAAAKAAPANADSPDAMPAAASLELAFYEEHCGARDTAPAAAAAATV